MKCVRLVRKDEDAVSPVIATILMVAITVVLAAVLYVMVSGFIIPPQPFGTMTVTVRHSGENWSVEVVRADSHPLPASTYLLIRDPQGVLSLAQTPWADLTSANWGTYRAQYQDANPKEPAIQGGDSLLISVAKYRSGSTFAVSADTGSLTTGSLQ